MNKKALSLVLAGVLSASAVFPAFATSGGAPTSTSGTDVYAGVIVFDPDARIKVEVPTLFAFVVNGTISTDASAVTSSNGGILLPNVKVKVDSPSTPLPGMDPGASTYSVQTVSDGVMKLVNYSTKADDDSTLTITGARTGLAVNVNGNIKNEGTEVSRNYWTYVPAIAGSTTVGEGDAAEFKQYNISIDNNALSTPADGGYELETAIPLGAPDLGRTDDGTAYAYTNMDTTTQLANTGVSKTLVFDVAVGGRKDQYKQVEESAKVGTIVWTVSAEINRDDVYTAPDNTYLDGVNSGANTDPDGIPLN